MYFSLILVAAGSSRRAGSDKLYEYMEGKTVLERAAEIFLAREELLEMVVVSRADRLEENRRLLEPLAGDKLILVAGGKTRAESVQKGMAALRCRDGLIAIHDAARPWLSAGLLERLLQAAGEGTGALPALKVTDTLYQVTSEGETEVLSAWIPREECRAVQTPQIFPAKLLIKAYEMAESRGDLPQFTDDASVFMAAGFPVKAVPGEEGNKKITTPNDISALRGGAGSAPFSLLIGHGYDAHRFAPGRPMLLCGVQIPVDFGLEGVSDADAPLHALIDALFGSAGLRDIGAHFPPKDPAYLGISSLELLRRTMRELAENRVLPISCDITIIAETPHLSQYIDEMRALLTGEIGCPINIKATTEEGMGFTGRKEGLAAHAVVLCRKETL